MPISIQIISKLWFEEGLELQPDMQLTKLVLQKILVTLNALLSPIDKSRSQLGRNLSEFCMQRSLKVRPWACTCTYMRWDQKPFLDKALFSGKHGIFINCSKRFIQHEGQRFFLNQVEANLFELKAKLYIQIYNIQYKYTKSPRFLEDLVLWKGNISRSRHIVVGGWVE